MHSLPVPDGPTTRATRKAAFESRPAQETLVDGGFVEKFSTDIYVAWLQASASRLDPPGVADECALPHKWLYDREMMVIPT